MSNFYAQLKRARLFGHPIHSMLVHFPSALFPISWLFDIIAVSLGNACLNCAGFYALGAGVILGFAAAIVGSIDYANLPASHTAWKKASLHALLNVTWLIIFAVEFGLRVKQFPTVSFATPLQLIFATVAVIGLIYSNFLGGDLIFRHKIGIDEPH